jgi:DHA2 family lincomycin resistance protein-like MFS transporter
MSAFSLGTLVAALAPGFEVLLVGRIIQAVGTALMMPLLITTVMSLVPVSRRGQMMGTITIVIAVAPAVGPTISGLILEVLDWRWMFWLVLPIALAALAIGARWVANVTAPQGAHLDVLSVALSAVGFSGVVYGLSSIGEAAQGETPVPPTVSIVIGAVTLALFAWRQLRLSERALLDLRVFASPLFCIATLLAGITMLTLLGALIIVPLYLQQVQGVSTLTTGLVLLPGRLAMGVLGPFVGRAYDRFGPRPLVVPASIIVVIALVLLSMLDQATTLGFVVGAHVVLMIGLALMFTPLLTTALGAVAPDRYSHGSAIVSTIQQVAGAAGAAIFITVMTRRAASISGHGTQNTGALAEGVQSAMHVGVAVAVLGGAVALRRPRTRRTSPTSLGVDAEAVKADPVGESLSV